MEIVRNQTIAELEPGASASLTRTLSQADVELFAFLAGDLDPSAHEPVVAAQGLGSSALISALIGTRLPGPGTVILGQDLHYRGSVATGDSLTATVTVREKHLDDHLVVLDCRCQDAHGRVVVAGSVTVAAPIEVREGTRGGSIEVALRRRGTFAWLMQACEGLPPVACAVVHPCDRNSLLGALEAARQGLIEPVLIGPQARVRALAAAEGIDLDGCRIVAVEHSHAAAEAAVALARAGEVEALMKGSLPTDELIDAVASVTTGLRSGRRISHVFVMDVPAYPRPLLITDTVLNIAPGLADKRDIVQNAIDLAHALRIEAPRVAILSVVETVNPRIASTLEAAALCKMADRGQITGAVLDGPLAFDEAISTEAAHAQDLVSPVAGQADILVVPNLEAGDMLAKQLAQLAGAAGAGVALGGRVPIALNGRTDSLRARLASAALLRLWVHARRTGGGA